MAELTKVEAIERLWNIGSHKIIDSYQANKIGKPFGLEFGPTVYKHDPRNYKSATKDYMGVSVFEIASRIADETIGSGRPSFFGRGTQFRTDLELSLKKIKEEGKV